MTRRKGQAPASPAPRAKAKAAKASPVAPASPKASASPPRPKPRQEARLAAGELTPKQQRWVAEYLVDLDATKAALRAGYKPASAKATGHRLSQLPEVQAKVRAAQARVTAQLEVTAKDVLAELAKVGMDPDVTPTKVRALELLGKHFQLFVERVDMNVSAMTPEDRAARAAALLEAAKRRMVLAAGGDTGDGDA